MQAVALLPRDGATLEIRRMFRPLEVDDPRLLARLSELARRQQTDEHIVGEKVEALLRSYDNQSGRCAICQRPASLDPVPIGAADTGEPCDDWCLEPTTENDTLAVGHRLCVKLKEERDKRRLADIQAQIDQLSTERRWLLALQQSLEQKETVEVSGGWELVEGLYDRYVQIVSGLALVVQLANEPPYSSCSRWRDEQKTLLEKRCHKTLCCDEWRPASDFGLRRPIKSGQLDSNDFFTCFCPHRGKAKADSPRATLKEEKVLPVLGGAKANSPRAMLKAGPVPGGRVAGAVLAARRMVSEEDAAGSKLGFAERRRELAQSAYSTHRRLLPLYVGSDAKVVLPSPPAVAAPEQQWVVQGGGCAVCKQKIELHHPLQWDIANGAWCWMHASCNPNIWKPYLAIRPLSELEEHRSLYRARHETDRLFALTVDKVRNSKSCIRIEVEKELLEALRQRAVHLAEQALVQTRFSGGKALRPEIDKWIAELKLADPAAAASIVVPPNQEPKTPSRKRRRASAPK